MVQLPEGMGMMDTKMPISLSNLIDKPLPDYVWVIEDMSDADAPPWVHVFASAPAALIVLGHKHKVQSIHVHDLPMTNTWTIHTDAREIIGALYYRKVNRLAGVQSIKDTMQ